MKLLIIGYGRMGRLVDELAGAAGVDVVGRLDIETIGGAWPQADVAIDFSIAEAGLGVVASANFSIGVTVFQFVVEEAARRMAAQPDSESWVHEAHHSAKRDAPSGTALLLRDAMVREGFGRSIDMSSTRAGKIPGTHTVGLDSQSDTIELTHTTRDRGGFARGALLAARWLEGRSGWFSMMDVLRAG